MDMTVKATKAEREAFRASSGASDLIKSDAMRERMVGDLGRIHAYEALLSYTLMKRDYLQDEKVYGVRNTGDKITLNLVKNNGLFSEFLSIMAPRFN